MITGNSNPTSNYWLCPLYLFNCYSKSEDFNYPPESVDLAQGIQIKRITPAFRHYLQKQHPDWEEASISDYMVALSHSGAVNEEKTTMLKEIMDKSNLLVDLVTALRLCHSGTVIPGPLIPSRVQRSGVFTFARHGISLVFGEIILDISKIEFDFASIVLQTEYEFYLSDVPIVNKLMREVRTCHESPKLSALNEVFRRFNYAYHGELEDRLIDQMIAFESLYIGDDKELGYKLALRTTILLEKDKDKRRAIFSDMKTAYDLRGKVVHGTKQAELSKLEEVIPKTEEYLRQSIRKFLMLHENYPLDSLKKGKNKRLAKLDENVLSNGDLIDTE